MGRFGESLIHAVGCLVVSVPWMTVGPACGSLTVTIPGERNMGTWFDGLAKRSARHDQESASSSGSSGLTRRQVIVRGAAVTGAAWTAPVLMSAFTAASAASPLNCGLVNGVPTTETTCPEGQVPPTKCCPADSNCGTTGLCVTDNTIGGRCTNSGEGQCGTPTARARCNGKTNPNVCGGNGAGCGSRGERCATGFTCVQPARGENPPANSPGVCRTSGTAIVRD
jgi:hypothetical protein